MRVYSNNVFIKLCFQIFFRLFANNFVFYATNTDAVLLGAAAPTDGVVAGAEVAVPRIVPTGRGAPPAAEVSNTAEIAIVAAGAPRKRRKTTAVGAVPAWGV